MEILKVIRQTLDIWQNPPLTELPEETLIDALNRVLTRHNLDLELTPDAAFHTEVSKPFTFADSTSREKNLVGILGDNSRIRRVESRLRTSTSEDDWEEETIVSFDNWNDVRERGDNEFVAFYGMTPNLTMAVARDVSQLEFRVVYRKLQDRIEAIADELEWPSIYEPLIVYDLALEVSELIDNRSEDFMNRKGQKIQFLLQRQIDSYNKVEQWRKSQMGNSVTQRRAFNDRRMDAEWRRGRRRFSVNY